MEPIVLSVSEFVQGMCAGAVGVTGVLLIALYLFSRSNKKRGKDG